MQWLKNILGSELLYHTVIAIAIVVVFAMFSRVVRAVLKFIADRVFSRTKTVLDDRIVAVVLRHVRPLLIVTSLHIAVREIRKGTAATDETILQILEYGDAILYIIAVILVVKIVFCIIREIIDWYLDRISSEGSSNLKMSLGPLTGKVANILVGMIATIIILDHFSVNIGSLLVSLGVGSLAVALAAQDTLANMIAGFVIMVDRPFRVGDRIELPSGQTGDVMEIGLRSTKVLNFDNNLIITPNAEIVKGRIINYSYPFNQMRAQVKMGVAYGTDPEKVRGILLALARSHPDIVPDPAPEVHFTAMNDSSIEFTLVARASDFKTQWAAQNMIREQAYRKFAEEGIEIPFPQRVVHMKTT
ncbi:MAG: mechanosensitive ion channel family protein [Bacteroidota bacterium]